MLTPLFVVSAYVALISPECSQDKNLLALRVHPTHVPAATRTENAAQVFHLITLSKMVTLPISQYHNNPLLYPLYIDANSLLIPLSVLLTR